MKILPYLGLGLGLSVAGAAWAGTNYVSGSNCYSTQPSQSTISYSVFLNTSSSSANVDCPMPSALRPSSPSVYVYDASSSAKVDCFVCYVHGSTRYCGSNTSSSSSGTGYSTLSPSWSSSTSSSTTGGGFYLGCVLPAASGTSRSGIADYSFTAY